MERQPVLRLYAKSVAFFFTLFFPGVALPRSNLEDRSIISTTKGAIDLNMDYKDYVVQLLESVPQRERKIALLQYELEHPAHISRDEMIDTLALSADSEAGQVKNHISDKTLYIALNYREKADRLNQEVVEDTATRLFQLEQERERLSYYVSLLEERQKQVIRKLFFQRLSPRQVSNDLRVSDRTVRNIKEAAIHALAEMYAYSGVSD